MRNEKGQFVKGTQSGIPFVKGQVGYWKGKKRAPFSEGWKSRLGRAGDQHHFFGKPITDERRRKISLANKGRRLSLEHRVAIGNATKGEHNPFFGRRHSSESRRKIGLASRGRWAGERNPKWRGGTAIPNQIARGSTEYKHWRKAVFERDDYTCQNCGKRGGELNADHIKPFAFFPDARFAIENGKTLCEPCHKKTPTYCKPTYQPELPSA